jgi:PAS domain S-box-containing protein
MASIDKIMKSRLTPSQAPGNDKSQLARTSKKIKAEIEKRFGFFPPFFTPALKTPEILENLWQQTLSAYVNNPLPALFKEKLFAYLSRYCAVPYCIICHSCALRPLGMTAAEVLALLTEPGPATEMDIGKHRNVLAAQSSPLEEWPAPGSALDESLTACSIFSFLNPRQAEDCRAQLRRSLGEEKSAYLMVFLGYVKTCHLWVEAHPELSYEADKRAQENLGHLLAEEPRLAEFFSNYNELIARERQDREESLRAERRKTEQALRESEDRMGGIINSAMDAVISVDDGQRIILFNAAAEKMFGYSAEEVMGRPISILIPERLRASHERHIHRFGVTGETDRMMGTLGAISGLRRNGEEFPIEASISQIEIGAKKLFTVILRDITGRVRAEAALRESQERMASILDTTIDGIITVDDDQRIVLFNAAAEKIFRCSAAEAIGQSIDRFIPERFRRTHLDQVRAFGLGERAHGAMGVRTVYGLRADGEEFPMEASISKVEVGGRKLYTVIHRDVTESLRANERLIEQAALLDQSHEAILVRGLDNRIHYWSRGAERLYGWTAEEAVGRPVQELIYRGELMQLADANRIVVEKGAWNGELRHITKYGREVIVEAYWTLVRDAEGKPKTILAITTDITEKKKLESHFLRAQRLESIGTLASGIAHDLNNILSPITMGAQMLQMKQQDEQSRRLLEVMRANAERGAEMIKQLLSFARGTAGERVLIQPKHLIREIVGMAQETFPRSIRLVQHLPEGLWVINGDATQLHQALMNLCVNARDAMPNGGALTIEADNHILDEIYAGMLRGASPGNFVVITVTDTGEGIPPEIIDRIFDPFFTTKAPGRGTGLGLASVQGIVTSHGGFITVESQPGTGTTFKIYLPAHEAANRREVEEIRHEILPGGGELILVIDDEDAIREMTRTILERFGYRALTADNGATALGIFASHKDEISIVITDMMMPVMDGPVTIRALQKLNPQVCIIASSGLTESIDAADLDRLGVKTFLIKPYDAKTLLKTVAQALR